MLREAKSQSVSRWSKVLKRRPVRRVPRRRGTVLVLTVLLMVVFLGLVAFAVDLGYVLHARTELQRTADACALAAAKYLPDESAATSAAQVVATENRATVGPDLDVSGIAFGVWDRDSATFTAPPPFGNQANAVRVTLERTEAAGNPLSLFFARFLGEATADASASATAMYDRWLCGPFVGIDWVSVPGTPHTDSYNSEKEIYNPAAARDRGSICSDGPINIDGTPVIRGDARSGKGFDVTITGSATVTGSVGRRIKPMNLPPVDASQAALQNDNWQIPMIPEGKSFKSAVDPSGNFLLDGNQTMDLPPGTYYLNNFTLEGGAVFNISGPTTIYLTGNLSRAGRVIVNNSTQRPANLKFLMTGGTALVTSGNEFHGVIYAPNTSVTIDGGSDLFGAVVGRTLTITGSGEAHYDESLNLGEIEFPRRTVLVD